MIASTAIDGMRGPSSPSASRCQERLTGTPVASTPPTSTTGRSTTLAVEFGYATATHAGSEGVIIAMLLGGVMAMMGSMALSGIGSDVADRVLTASEIGAELMAISHHPYLSRTSPSPMLKS